VFHPFVLLALAGFALAIIIIIVIALARAQYHESVECKKGNESEQETVFQKGNRQQEEKQSGERGVTSVVLTCVLFVVFCCFVDLHDPRTS
jgi:hypothetical protein